VQLNAITANIRLRNAWEAMDLGFAMVQHWWKIIFLPWIILAVSISVIIYLLLPTEYFAFGILVFWWLKPLYDRLLLHIISHKLFNEEITTWQALKLVPHLIKQTGLLSALTFRRASFSRGFNLPIWQLEQLRGSRRSDRQATLHIGTHSQAVWLTIGMLILESALLFSVYALIILFLPPKMMDEVINNYFITLSEDNIAPWVDILEHAFYTLTVIILEPFYVAASFSLYLNRRTQLEAWDIEITFRNLASRLKANNKKIRDGHALAWLLIPFCGALLLFSAPERAQAEPIKEYLSDTRLAPEKSKDVISEIVKSDELSNEKIIKRWVEKDPQKKKKQEADNFGVLADILKPITKLISILFESLLWVALAIAVILLFIFRDRWLHLFQTGQQKLDDYQPPDVLLGMDIRPDSLPADIPGTAQQLWQQDKHREALSLLYRGALAQLVSHDEIPLTESHTEGDILRLSAQTLQEGRLSYLEKLTAQWRLIAYAHRTPETDDMHTLFNHWQSEFIGSTT
jgi:hypothetical protein